MVEEEKKKHGAFFTASDITKYLVKRVIKTTDQVILEPSFGDGVFIDAIVDYYNGKRQAEKLKENFYGVEIRKEAIEPYRTNSYLDKNKLLNEDFLRSQPFQVDVVLGNPPYVSLNKTTEKGRNAALDILKFWDYKMPLNGSLWVPFILHSMSFLKQGGILAFVLPYEMAYVKYTKRLWKLLSDNFSELHLIRVFQDIFPDVDVETILFIAKGYGGSTKYVTYEIYKDKKQLFDENIQKSNKIIIKDILDGDKPFTSSLLKKEHTKVINSLRSRGLIKPISTTCKFNIGYVCADKVYFHPTESVIKKYSLKDEELISAIPNAKVLKNGAGLFINSNFIKTKLFLPKSGNLSDGTSRYIEYGINSGVNLRFKCRNRKPWYITPGVDIPDIILTVFGDRAGLYINRGNAAASNSLLCGFLQSKMKPEEIAVSWYNSITQLSIELKIHSLGGGVLVFIPGEADMIEVIDSNLVKNIKSSFVKRLDKLIKNNNFDSAYALGDEIVLRDIGVSDYELKLVREAIDILREWRNSKLRKGI